MLKNNSKEVFITSLIIFYIFILLFSIKYLSSNIYVLNTTFLLFLSYVFYLFYGYRKYKVNIYIKQYFYKLLINFLFFCIFFLSTGFLFGYERNILNLTKVIFVFFYLLGIILEECIRYISVNKNREDRYLSFAVSILFSFLMSFSLLDSIFLKVISFILILFYNVILNYLCYHLGFKFNCICRVGYEFFLLLIPIFPNINIFYVILFVLISMIFFYNSISSDFNFVKIKIEHNNFYRNCSVISSVLLMIILIFTIILVSGKAEFYMIGIGSNSMNPAIKKGDAIVVRKIKNDSFLKIGDIIVYNYENSKIVHRIHAIEFNNDEVKYITKGDNNQKEDELKLAISDIEGIVSFKVPYIAYPAITLKESFYE